MIRVESERGRRPPASLPFSESRSVRTDEEQMWGDVCSLVSHICIYFREGNTLFQRERERGWMGLTRTRQGGREPEVSSSHEINQVFFCFYLYFHHGEYGIHTSRRQWSQSHRLRGGWRLRVGTGEGGGCLFPPLHPPHRISSVSLKPLSKEAAQVGAMLRAGGGERLQRGGSSSRK